MLRINSSGTVLVGAVRSSLSSMLELELELASCCEKDFADLVLGV